MSRGKWKWLRPAILIAIAVAAIVFFYRPNP